MKKTTVIRPQLGFLALTRAALLHRANAIFSGTMGNPAYPNPPVDAATFKSVIDGYSAALTAALDGSKTAIAEREKQRHELIAILRKLGHYVESCRPDLPTFLPSGFVPVATIRATTPQPLADPDIRVIEQGNTGQLLIFVKPLRKALHYEIRYAAAGDNGATASTTVVLTSSKEPARVNNLTPGAIYTFEVRALGKGGFTDWSRPISRMCI